MDGAVFELIHRARNGDAAVLCAFDLIELDGADLRRAPIEHRKHKLARLVRTQHPGIVVNEHYEGDGEIVFAHACKLGCERIVAKRLGSLYRSGRSAYWVKVKNPKAPAVKREAEEEPAPSCSAKMRRGGLRRTSLSCRSCCASRKVSATFRRAERAHLW
jgi:hypothetical protein